MAAPKRGGILRKPSGSRSRPNITFAQITPSAVHSVPRSTREGTLRRSSSQDQFYAASTGQANWLQMTLQKTESPTQSDINGFSALHTAALFGRLDCLKVLVENYGVNVDSPSHTGWRPVHLVMNKESEGRALECLQYLISKKADINAQNQNGVSPLHKAASEGRTNCIKLLIDAGADVHAKDAEGQEPIDLCKMWGHRASARYLTSAMWKIDKRILAREVSRLNEIKKECLVKKEEALRMQQMERNRISELVFLEWLAKKHLSRPSARLLSLLEMRARPVTLFKEPGIVGSPTSSLWEMISLESSEEDVWQQPWNMSSNPASLPAACIFRPTVVRLGTSPEPSVDHDFSSFLFLVKSGSRELEIRIGKSGAAFPVPAVSYGTAQRSLYPHAWPSRLRVPQGLKPRHIWDVQRKRPPSPEHRWTDQMALSLRQTLDPAFIATLKAHLATYSDTEVLLAGLDSDYGGSKEPSSPSLSGSSSNNRLP